MSLFQSGGFAVRAKPKCSAHSYGPGKQESGADYAFVPLDMLQVLNHPHLLCQRHQTDM